MEFPAKTRGFLLTGAVRWHLQDCNIYSDFLQRVFPRLTPFSTTEPAFRRRRADIYAPAQDQRVGGAELRAEREQHIGCKQRVTRVFGAGDSEKSPAQLEEWLQARKAGNNGGNGPLPELVRYVSRRLSGSPSGKGAGRSQVLDMFIL